MMLLAIAGCVMMLGVLVLAFSPYGARATGFVVLLASVLAVPASLVGRSSAWHVGIAGPVPALSTFTVGVLLALAMQWWRNARRAWILILPATLWIATGSVAFWGSTSEVVAGALLLATGLLAFVVGVAFGAYLDRDARPAVLVAVALLALVAFQVLVAVLQQLGYEVLVRNAGQGEEFQTGRVSGTLGHANNLGKAMVLAFALALPLTRSRLRACRQAATLTILLGFVALGLSEGRANGAAAIAMVVLWAVLTPKSIARAGRWFLPLVTFGVALAFVGPILERFNSDPAGGSREHFKEVALREIPHHLLVGVGPNSYVSVIGRTDRLTAEGWPVHNAFLLAVGELGLLGAIFLLVPWVATSVRAFGALRRPGADGDFARAHVALLPGILAISTTGWAMIQQNNLVFWMLVTGVVLGQVQRGEPDDVEGRRSGRSGRATPRAHTTGPGKRAALGIRYPS